VRGEPPPDTLKVAVNYLAGYRNTMTLVLTGLDIEEKARVAEEAIWARVPKDSFDEVDVTLTEHGLLRITVMDADRERTGRAFSSAVVETGLANYPGFYGLTPPGPASPYGVYWPVLVPASEVRPEVYVDGERIPLDLDAPRGQPVADVPAEPETGPQGEPAVRMPLGRIAGARSGDKGGNANLGVWTTSPERYAWLDAYLTTERLKSLLPELAPYRVDRHPLPNLNAVNFVVHGLLGRGVAASPRMDPQAKALGEELRARPVEVPARLAQTV